MRKYKDVGVAYISLIGVCIRFRPLLIFNKYIALSKKKNSIRDLILYFALILKIYAILRIYVHVNVN